MDTTKHSTYRLTEAETEVYDAGDAREDEWKTISDRIHATIPEGGSIEVVTADGIVVDVWQRNDE